MTLDKQKVIRYCRSSTLLVSIIVPVYNCENSIRRCLDSLIGQTYREVEIIIVDDGSSDRSLEVCKNYAAKDNRICCLHKDNGGVSSARNMGIDHAKGDILTFVDSDDFVLPSFIETIANAFDSFDVDVVVTRFATGNESGYEYRETEGAMTIFGTYKSIDFEKRLYPVHNWVEHGMIACVWGKGYKRKIFGDLRFEGRYSEDDRFIDELNSKNYIIKVIDEIGYVYCYNPNSLIRNKDNQHRTDFLDILIRRLELFADDSFIVENTSKLFCNLYIEYYYGIGKANRNLITGYMKDFNSCLKLLQTRKTDDRKFLLRMTIFRISPILYKTITSIASSIK